jgi:hypothetical protein
VVVPKLDKPGHCFLPGADGIEGKRIMVITTNPSAIKTQEATSSDAKITRGTLSRAGGRLNYRVSG